jgi:hypothetical protein
MTKHVSCSSADGSGFDSSLRIAASGHALADRVDQQSLDGEVDLGHQFIAAVLGLCPAPRRRVIRDQGTTAIQFRTQPLEADARRHR